MLLVSMNDSTDAALPAARATCCGRLVRDNFSRATITEIAKGVAYRCSNPECRRATVGANAAQTGTLIIGVAAHICGASPGGPRHDPRQTPEERRSKENGIWLCQSCGRLVDVDPGKFTVEQLQKWKHAAQASAFRDLVAPAGRDHEEAVRLEAAIVADDARVGDEEFEELFNKARASAAADIATYKRGSAGSGSSVELTLRLEGEEATPSFSISQLPLAVAIAPEVTLIAPPGTGKTTTLLQLAGHALDAKAIIPLYFRLGDWSAGSTGLLASLTQRPAFKGLRTEHLEQLAERGRLLLLLDGWNELDPNGRQRLRVEVAAIRRNWPNARIVATTRRQMLDVPITGPRIDIEPLSEDQQMAIAEAQDGPRGKKTVDNAWRTAGVRELVAIPLYLSTLLAGGSKAVLPDTKEGVLRLFVHQHEAVGEHAEVLQSAMLGCHAEILANLASDLNTAGATTMNEADARKIVAATAARLREQGQIAGSLEPLTVLDTLIGHHTLKRSGEGISFQHQQFQEWYASREVEALMRGSAVGDSTARVRLRAAVLDRPTWEESVLFATERLSREKDGAKVIGDAVRLALRIDPMLAAEMIYRSAPAVWEVLAAEITDFVKRWHKPGAVDRAVRFMIMTGQPDFAPLIWPLAASSDTQTQLPTLRIAPRFRPNVLGPDIAERASKLPEETRAHLFALIALESGVEGMDLAVKLAKADPSPKVQSTVVQHLLFRRAERHAGELLGSANDETWTEIACGGYGDEIHDADLSARLHAVRQKALEEATEPTERLRLLLNEPADYAGRDAAIAAAIADPRFPVMGQQGGALHFAEQQAPDAVLQGLRQRLEAGLELPAYVDELLAKLPVIDSGPITAAILDTSRDNHHIGAATAVAGPRTTGALVDKFLECAKALKAAGHNRALGDESQRVKARICNTRPAIFAAAIIDRANTDNPEIIASLASLISQHGSEDARRRKSLAIDPTTKPSWLAVLRHWAKAIIAAPTARRYHLCEVGNAIGKLGFPELVPELKALLDQELLRLKSARATHADARSRGDSSDASMRYDNQYQAAFIRIGGEEVASVAAQYLENHNFGTSAAHILKALAETHLSTPEPSTFRRWPWFDEVAQARANRAAPPKPDPLYAFAEPIFRAVDKLATADAGKDDQLLAIDLLRVGLGMPHVDHDALIARVMALPQPLAAKQTLLSAMVMDGYIVEADLIMKAIDEWLDDANDPKRQWHKRQNTWEIEPWLELLPFSTRPEAVLDGLAKVKAFYGNGWHKQWERVLQATAAVPGKEGEVLLEKLAREHPDIAHDHSWMRAILDRGSLESILLYVDLFIEGVLDRGRDVVDAWHVARRLRDYVQQFPELKPKLEQRYVESGSGPGRTMLEHFFAEAGTESDLLAMIEKYAANGQSYDGRMDGAVRAVALLQVPVAEGSNAYNIFPASVRSLRKALFDRLDGSRQEAALANSCLIAIDRLRDEYGIAAADPRHPDVMSERPWPPEAP